jgi:hypothetical protein
MKQKDLDRDGGAAACWLRTNVHSAADMRQTGLLPPADMEVLRVGYYGTGSRRRTLSCRRRQVEDRAALRQLGVREPGAMHVWQMAGLRDWSVVQNVI